MEPIKSRFTIVITESFAQTVSAGQEWRQGADISNGTDAWGYTPEIEIKSSTQTEIFKQSVEYLDLGAVIKVINNL